MPASMYTTLVSAQGFIPLPLPNWRLVASNDVPVIAVVSGNGGNLASDSSPKLIRVSTSTDKCLRILWASSTSIEIFQQIFYPPDMDVTSAYTINFRIGKSANTDATCTFTVGCFEGVGDTDRGGATAVLGASAVTSYSRSITPTAAHPNFAVFTLTPGTHTTDDIYLYEAYILYQKKLLSSWLPMNPTSPNTLPPVVGRVEILLHADGNVSVKAEMPHQCAFLGALEMAKFSIAAKYAEQQRAAAEEGIAIPPPGLVNRLNGKG